MSDIKDDDSSEENEELRRRNQARLEDAMTPEWVRGVRAGPTMFPAPPADLEKWAKRDLWHIREWPEVVSGFEPVDSSHPLRRNYFWPPGVEDNLKAILEVACSSLNAGKLREWEPPSRVLAWLREKGFPIRKELEEAVNRFHPEAEASPQGGDDATNDPIAKRKAPDLFVAALFRLIAEIAKRATEKGMPFDVTSMPGTKADFRALAIKFDDNLDKAERTFDDYLAGLVRFKQGARETTYYQELFPEYFAPRRSDP